MTKTAFLLFFLSINLIGFSQKPDCMEVHLGKFSYSDEQFGTTNIERTKRLQIEENTTLGYKIIFRVKWLDDCTYQGKLKKVVKGDMKGIMKKGDTLTTHITNVNAKSYTSVTTSNFSDLELKVEINRVDEFPMQPHK